MCPLDPEQLDVSTTQYGRNVIIDELTLSVFTLQIEYPPAYAVWDSAGALANRMAEIWGDLEPEQAGPNEQTLANQNVRIVNGLRTSHVTLLQPKAIDPFTTNRIHRTYLAWHAELGFTSLKRLSARIRYYKNFDKVEDAVRRLSSLGVYKHPAEKVFDQRGDSARNSYDLVIRFDDEQSFTHVTVKTESAVLRIEGIPEFDFDTVNETKSRFVLEFDRGLRDLAAKPDILRIDEWVKGYMHVMRRDIEKVMRSAK